MLVHYLTRLMKGTRISIALAIWCFITTTIAHAELFNCDGRWTNKPCTGRVTKTLASQPERALTSRASLKSVIPTPEREACPSGQYFINERPEPLFRWETRILREGELSDRVRISGTVLGYGKVKITVKTHGRLNDGHSSITRQRSALTRYVKLPNEGGETTFEGDFDLLRHWDWQLYGENHSRFEGFCSAVSQAQLTTEWRRQKVAT